jgi:5'-deoxynucleotidase
MEDMILSYNFFALISRMRYISRWSLMRNSYTENIQEHSHMVAVLAHALAVIRRDILGQNTDPNACAAAALFHDAPEILTGDLPTPVKYYNPEIRDAYKKVESVAETKLLAMLPEVLRPTYAPLLQGGGEDVHRIVKAADKLAAYIKCLEELDAGNQEFKRAAQETLAVLQGYRMPEVDYFIEHFSASFGLTLDELN